MVAAVPIAVIAHDLEGYILAWNQAAERDFGWREDEVLGKPNPLIPPEGREEFLGLLSAANAGLPLPGPIERHPLRRDGSRSFCRLTLAPLTGADGTIHGLVAFLSDVAEQRRTESALRDADERFRLIAHATSDVLWDWDVPTGTIWWSDGLERLFGYTKDQVGPTVAWWTERIHPDERERVITEVDRALAGTPDLWIIEYNMLRADGRYCPVEDRLCIVRDNSGRATRVVSAMVDIRDRRRSEDLVRRGDERQREAARHLQDILDTMFVFVGILSPDGTVREINRAPADAAGIDRNDLLGHRLPDTYSWCYSTLVQERLRTSLRRVALGLTVREEVELRVRHDGRITVDLTLAPLWDSQGHVHQIVASAIDVTARKRAEHDRHEMEKKILHVQKLESLGVLAGGIAHDFNNLLMGMLGNASVALRLLDPEAPAPARSAVADIETTARRAAELTRQMLDYSGKGKFVSEVLDLSELAREMVALLSTVISKSTTVRFELLPELPPIRADAAQIRQVIVNLVTNASDALADAPGTLTVRTGVMDASRDYLKSTYVDEELPAGEYVYLEVQDTGCGMDAVTRARIFDPFYTTKFTGRGLGLATVLGIIRGHHGAIEVRSEPAVGTSMIALFPRVHEKLPQKHTSPTTRLAKRSWQGKVLLVDDEAIVQKVARRMLEAFGFTVLTANDGRQAIDLFLETRPVVVVLMDLTMPTMGGLEAMKELRRLDPSVRVLLTSGYTEEEVTHRTEGTTASGFLQKPFRIDELHDKLCELLPSETSS
jgi:PAS domain S-box-containing protein